MIDKIFKEKQMLLFYFSDNKIWKSDLIVF